MCKEVVEEEEVVEEDLRKEQVDTNDRTKRRRNLRCGFSIDDETSAATDKCPLRVRTKFKMVHINAKLTVAIRVNRHPPKERR